MFNLASEVLARDTLKTFPNDDIVLIEESRRVDNHLNFGADAVNNVFSIKQE